MFEKVYAHIVEPINGREAWAKTAYTQPMPPNVKPSTGRPKMKRNKKNDTPAPPGATSLKRVKTSLKCGNCDAWGHNRRTCKTKKNEEKRPEQNEAEEGEQYQRAEENQPNQVEQEQRHEFSPGASQPTIEVNDSQGGIFGPPPGKRTTAACGVAPKAWQNKKQTVTTRTEILRARSVREKKATQRYHD
ncbi:hypothetical protein POM88_009074 [Heracleum sosnowskyi]|uniref:Uncharacterized protein n=1 Tax=Heracleum sosnowskyi TaxID=360622 RepID=A0AAD8N803_9APIA|nr:hypothetical protein POM88_009074 [Heracleum sosnowskyi]